MNKLYMWAAAASAIIMFSFQAQARDIRGKVVDTEGNPLPGVAVISPSQGAMTQSDGSFIVKAPDGETVLEFSCLGYVTQQVTVSSVRAVVDVVLEEDAISLDETVVIGYGTAKKVNLTGAISTVSSKDLAGRNSPTLTHMLQGSVPGLYVTTSSGNPANEASVNIRGYASINNASGNTLVLIDGVEGSLSKVNPMDVESVSVIKDASSSAIYGARAAYGVILVTTKSGSNTSRRPTVHYNGTVGFSVPTTNTLYETRGYDSVLILDKFFSETDGKNYSRYTKEDMEQLLLRRDDVTENPERPWILTQVRGGRESYIYYCNTDWYHKLYTDFNPFTRHNVSLSGGDKYVKYYFSGGYDHKEGTFQVRPEQFNKFNLRSKVDININKWLSLSDNMSYYHQDYDYPGNSSIDYTFAYSSVHAMASLPDRNPDGSWVYKTIFSNSNVTNGVHMELGDDTKYNRRNKQNFSNTLELSFHPVDGLDIKANYTWSVNHSLYISRWTNTEYSKWPGLIETDKSGRFLNHLEEWHNQNDYQAANLYATYGHTFAGKHNFKAVLGANYETSYYKNHYTDGNNLSSDYINDYNTMLPDSDGNIVTKVTGGQGRYVLEGVFGRINYDYMEKYLAELSFRADGSSKFLRDNWWGFFPSVSAGWKFSDEEFFSPLRPVWSAGKVRASVGTLGNQSIGDYYKFVRLVNINNQSYLFGGDSVVKGATLSDPASTDLTWETAKHYNLGFDLGFLSDRLTFTGDFFIRDTEGMQVSGEIVPATYGRGVPERNAADLRSQGYELVLGWKDTFNLAGRPFTYGVTATLADDIAYITKYDNPTLTLGSYYEGMVIGGIWGYRTDGFFKSDEEAIEYTSKIDCENVGARLTGGWRAGDLKFLDTNGDGEISKGGMVVGDSGDWTIIGNSRPRWQYGLTLSAQWAGFNLSLFLCGIGHQDLYPQSDNTAFWGPYNREASYIQRDFLDKVWSPEHPDTYYPRPRGRIAYEGNTYITTKNDHFLLNMAYCRLKNLTVGYTLPSKVTDRLHLEGVRVFFVGENLAYWSALKDINPYIDPEQMLSGGTLGFRYPWQKPFTFGVDISF